MVDWCFYCGKAIYSFDKRVDGVEVHAHQRCVQKRIEEVCPTWRETKAEAATRRGKAGAFARFWPKKPSQRRKRATLKLLQP
jgi:hypothetical protein